MNRLTEFMELRAGAEAELRRKAAELKAIAESGLESAGGLNRLSSGFLELADLADTCQKKRFCTNSRQLSKVFTRTIRSIPEDVPFILKVAVDFLGKISDAQDLNLQQVSA